MITSSYVATTILNALEPEGWVLHHRFDYNPMLVNRLGAGDRRFVKSDDVPPVILLEPNLTLTKGSTALIIEVDFKYSKKAFESIALLKNTPKKTAYLKRFFGGKAPRKIFYGLAMPHLDLHVDRGLAHLDNLDFFLSAGKEKNLYCIKPCDTKLPAPFPNLPPRPKLNEKKGK
jgi:hypothetical protein